MNNTKKVSAESSEHNLNKIVVVFWTINKIALDNVNTEFEMIAFIDDHIL